MPTPLLLQAPSGDVDLSDQEDSLGWNILKDML